MIPISQAQKVIKELNPTFDTHDFIEKFSRNYEREYVEIIYKYYKKSARIFMSAHAAIGKFLSDETQNLKIEKQSERVSSRNIKGYKSPNQRWRKL